jgi:hypothetical protein
MAAHTGRCFRAWRGTVKRKATQGIVWTFPIRQKVPLALRAFANLTAGNQRHINRQGMQMAILNYATHQAKVGRASARGR